MPPAQEHFIRALYDTFPESVVFVDSDAVVISMNDSARRTFGYDDGELVGRHVSMIYVDRTEYESALDLGFRSVSPVTVEGAAFRYRRKDGSLFFGQLTGSRVLDENQTLCGYIGVVRDVSELVARERERAELKQLLDSALDSIPEGFMIFDPEERIILSNRAFREMCGDAKDAVVPGASLEDIFRANLRAGTYPDYRDGTPEAEAWLASRLRDHRDPAHGTVMRYGDNRWARSESRLTEAGHIVGLRIDITDIKQVELALEARQREYLSLLQNLPDMICRFDGERRLQFFNDRYAALYGEAAAERIGLDLYEVAAEKRPDIDFSDDQPFFTPQSPVRSCEVRHVGQNGEALWILWTVVAIFSGETPVEYVAVGRDITDAKRQQERMAEQTLELQRKNDALNQFTATVSHDLKAPLRHIAMFSEMIADDIRNGQSDELVSYAGHIRSSVRRMQRLVESLLEYSQIAYRIGKVTRVPLRAIVADVLAMMESQVLETGASVTIGHLPHVEGDGELLNCLVRNLIGNALKYRHPETVPAVRIYGRKDADGVTFVVEDDGIGIDAKFEQKIFDVFQRLHRDESVYPGTGIGLALARRIVESHNGTIALDTAYRPGARFVVHFPLSAGQDRLAAAPHAVGG